MPKGIVTKIILSIFTVFILFIVGYGAFMGVYHYTSQPEFCSKCHYVNPYVVSWEESPHKDINCLQCHEPSGPLGKLHSKGRGLNYYLMDKTGNHADVITETAYINERNCIVCHTLENNNYSTAPRINRTGFDHFESIKNNVKCINCHENTGHSTEINLEERIK